MLVDEVLFGAGVEYEVVGDLFVVETVGVVLLVKGGGEVVGAQAVEAEGDFA